MFKGSLNQMVESVLPLVTVERRHLAR